MSLDRLTRVLDGRGIAVDPVLAVVGAVGIENVFLGVGTLSGRVQLLVPSRPAAVAVVASGVTLPERSMLLVSAGRGEPLAGALVIGGATTLRNAVGEVGPPDAAHLWLPIVEWLTGGTIKNRTRYLSDERGSITVSFMPRSAAEDEARFTTVLTTVASRVKAPDSWRNVYDEAGAGAEVGVTTECTPAGPRPRLALRFGKASWDRAIDLARALAGVEQAREAAVCMGTLAAVLGIDELRAVEAVVEPGATDLVAWLAL